MLLTHSRLVVNVNGRQKTNTYIRLRFKVTFMGKTGKTTVLPILLESGKWSYLSKVNSGDPDNTPS